MKDEDAENHIIVGKRIRAWLYRNISSKIGVTHSTKNANVFIISWTDGPTVEDLAKELEFFLGRNPQNIYSLGGKEYEAVESFVFKRSYSKERYEIISKYLDQRLGTKNIIPIQFEIMERDLIRQNLLNYYW